MLGKIKQIKNKGAEWIDGFRDTKIIGLILFLIIILMVSWSSANVIGTNYGLQQQIKRMEQENRVQQLANDNVELQNQYYETPQYSDIAARQHFGLASEGEKVLVVPDSVAIRFTTDTTTKNSNQEKSIQETNNKQPAYQRNFQAWMNFLLHRD